MSGVGVLAVMDEAARDAAIYAPGADDARHNDLLQARAAVGTLIQAADTAATVLSNLIESGQVAEGYSQYVTDLTAALARVSGGAA